jgi:hypothetical protein
MQSSIKYLLSFFIFIFISSCNSQSTIKEEIIIEDAWSRPAIKGGTSAIYFKLRNQLLESDKLLSVISEIAEFTEIHLSTMEDEKMMMVEQDFVLIESNQTVEFKPKSYHIMLINLKGDLKPGDQFEIFLFFEKSGQMKTMVEVKETE